MKLTKYIILPLLLMLLVTGCSGSNFNDHMQKGKDAIASRNYDEAKNQFSFALEAKSKDEEANALYRQVIAIIEAIDNAEENNFDAAIKKCNEVTDIQSESTVIKNQAEEYIKKYTKDIDNVNTLKVELQNNILHVSGIFDEGRYEDCIVEIDKILVTVEGYETALKEQKLELEKIKSDCESTIKQIEEEKIAEEKRLEEEAKKAEEEVKRKAEQKESLIENGKLYEKKIIELDDKDKKVKSENKKPSKDESIGIVEEVYERWDLVLNNIYDYLMKTLDQDKKDYLYADEQKWIEEKLSAGKAAALKVKDEDRAHINNLTAQIKETRKRCIILVNTYMYTNIAL